MFTNQPLGSRPGPPLEKATAVNAVAFSSLVRVGSIRLQKGSQTEFKSVFMCSKFETMRVLTVRKRWSASSAS